MISVPQGELSNGVNEGGGWVVFLEWVGFELALNLLLQKMRYIGNTLVLPNLKKKGNIKG